MIQHFAATDKHFTAMKLFWHFGQVIIKCQSVATAKEKGNRYLIAYIPSQLPPFAYAWFSGLREPLAKTAYRDIWINFTSLFVLLCIINTVIYIFKKKREQKGEKE